MITHWTVGCQQQQRLQQCPPPVIRLPLVLPLEEAHHLVSGLLWNHKGEATLSANTVPFFNTSIIRNQSSLKYCFCDAVCISKTFFRGVLTEVSLQFLQTKFAFCFQVRKWFTQNVTVLLLLRTKQHRGDVLCHGAQGQCRARTRAEIKKKKKKKLTLHFPKTLSQFLIHTQTQLREQ